MTIQEKRRLAGLTQHELARLSNIPIGRITFAETRRIKLKRSERERIDTALKLELARQMARIVDLVAS